MRRAERPVDWAVSDTLVDYEAAVAAMEARAQAIFEGQAPECVWLLEHPPLYTAGTSARAEDLVAPGRFPVFKSGRGGQFTYHGPGQRVAYAMLDLRRRGRDVRAYVEALEGWLIDTLAAFNVDGETREGRVGVWVRRPNDTFEDKIAAIGVRVRRWVAFHGISLNVSPDLSHFDGIVPCGVRGHGVTSLEALGRIVSMEEVDAVLNAAFVSRFGPVCRADPPVLDATAEVSVTAVPAQPPQPSGG
ncbi:MAG: lipoyl(octanoyl) transferase LipB [Devosia sp.]